MVKSQRENSADCAMVKDTPAQLHQRGPGMGAKPDALTIGNDHRANVLTPTFEEAKDGVK